MINRNICLALIITISLTFLLGCPWTKDPSVVDTGFSGRPQPATGGSGQWEQLSGTGGVRDTHTALWIIGYTDKGITGRMLVWGGRGIGGYLNSGSIWNQTTSEWTTTSLVGAPSARNSHTSIWTGAEMIIFAGRNTSGILNDGGIYSRASDSWIATSAPTRTDGSITFQTIASRVGHAAVWSGSRMIVFGGFGGFWQSGQGAVNNPAYLGDLQMYIPEFNTWLNGSTSGAPSARWLHTAVWTDTEMIVWGGSNPAYLNTGARYNPTNDTWTSMATTGAPVGRERHTALWTGTGTIQSYDGLDRRQ
ncbi:MAG: hypothetical protein HY762_01175 [Planctomycetes bacterium]|nr:hypothetical protein [Planctomycetota bacterium]